MASCSLGVCVLIPLILYRYRILDWDSVIQFNLIITCLYQHGLPRWLSGKESACIAGATGDTGSIPGSGRSPGEGMATHSSILAWRILWTKEPGGLQSMGSQRVRHDWSDLARKLISAQTLFLNTITVTGTGVYGLSTSFRGTKCNPY